MGFLFKLKNFLERYRWAITMALAVLVIMQHCTISTLQKELRFVRDKYEVPATVKTTPTDNSATNAAPQEAVRTAPPATAEEAPRGGLRDNNYWAIVALVLLVGLTVFVLYRKGKLPFGVHVSGKLWQDLNGRVVYTLSVRNRTRKDVTVEKAQIEFIRFRAKRKFTMPVPDFPITLSAGTSHSVNISLQRLLESDQTLLDFKVIRVSVECNARRRRTAPIGVKWKR